MCNDRGDCDFYYRYIEIFKSSMMEAETAIEMQGRYNGPSASGFRPGPYDRSAGGARGSRGRGAGPMRGRGAGNIKGVMGK